MRATDTGQVGMFAHSLPQRSNLSALAALLDGTAASTHTEKNKRKFTTHFSFILWEKKKIKGKKKIGTFLTATLFPTLKMLHSDVDYVKQNPSSLCQHCILCYTPAMPRSLGKQSPPPRASRDSDLGCAAG